MAGSLSLDRIVLNSIFYKSSNRYHWSFGGFLDLKCLGEGIELPGIFPNSFIVNYIYLFHDSREEDAEMIADSTLGDFGI